MQRVLSMSVGLGMLCLLGTLPMDAAALCTLNSPLKANKLNAGFTRAFQHCVVPGSVNSVGIPACEPPTPESAYLFGPRGQCSAKFSAKPMHSSACGADPSDSPCTDLLMKVGCKDILDSDTAPIVDEGQPWVLAATWRVSIDDPENGPMTVVVLPFQFEMPAPSKGRIKHKASTNDVLEAMFGPGNPLPGCTSAELVDLAIADPTGARFASIGATGTGTVCAVNHPRRATGFKTRMVRAVEACPNPTFPAPNTVTEAGIPACYPPLPLSSFKFLDGVGKCYFKASAMLDGGGCAADPAASECLLVPMKTVCSDIRAFDDSKIKPSAGDWKIRVRLRMTIDDRGGSAMTVIDRDIDFGNAAAGAGSLKAEAELSDLLVRSDGAGASLPPCSSIEILDVAIVDATGEVFAKSGMSARP